MSRRTLAKTPSGPASRDKRAKFVELANNRVNRTLKELALIGNLANKRNYEYSDEQARKIVRALQAGLDQVKSRFSSGGTLNESNFEL